MNNDIVSSIMLSGIVLSTLIFIVSTFYGKKYSIIVQLIVFIIYGVLLLCFDVFNSNRYTLFRVLDIVYFFILLGYMIMYYNSRK